jgi:hypothetical protein
MFNILGPYKYVVDLLVVAALVGGALFAVHTYNGYQQQIGYDRRDVEQVKVDKAKAETQRLRELALQKERDDAERKGEEQAARSAVERDAAIATNRVLNGTIKALNTRVATAPIEAVRKYAATCGAVLSACTAEYQAVGADAQGHADDSLKLQNAWPTK